MIKTEYENIRAFLRYRDFRVGVFLAHPVHVQLWRHDLLLCMKPTLRILPSDMPRCCIACCATYWPTSRQQIEV